jgi:predicted N-formylglutamate amidohydrolase
VIFQKSMLENGRAVNITNASGQGGIVFVSEHASRYIPQELQNLGLSLELVDSHIAWDPGALHLAEKLSDAFDAPLVASSVSRLIYDCNRPPESIGAIPTKSENHVIPGNIDLTHGQRESRIEHIYVPFSNALESTLNTALDAQHLPCLITIHSFTPVYDGLERDVEIGILHDSDSRLADHILANAAENSSFIIRRNEPYGPKDGVTHTLKKHALPNAIPNVMIEVRNDLIMEPAGVARVANELITLLKIAVKACQQNNPNFKKEVSPK